MTYTPAHSIPFYKRFLFAGGVFALFSALLLYIVFVYLSVQMSYAFEYEKRLFAEDEKEYQGQEQGYLAALDRFHTSKELDQLGFVKIASPVFLSRTLNVAIRNE